uniref:Outer dense fiber protein 3 n=1 Tax=Cacopsylla melanoneura TaxID=428564 RepID=A0A8D8VSQ0_9HEMI
MNHTNIYAQTFGARTPLPKPLNTPAPGAYNPEKATDSLSNHTNLPAYTFRLKTEIEKPSNTPGPNVYCPEKATDALSNHTNIYAQSFGARTALPKPMDTPAPNVYCPEKATDALSNHVNIYAQTFGTRTSLGKPLEGPGPGTYNYSNPDSIKPKSPAYSVASRHQMPGDTTAKPGPGAYSPEKTRIDIPPAHSFGIRHSPFITNLHDINRAIFSNTEGSGRSERTVVRHTVQMAPVVTHHTVQHTVQVAQ